MTSHSSRREGDNIIDTIIFDLDDTLTLEIDYVKSGIRAVSQWAADQWHESPEETEQKLWDLFSSGDKGRVFDQWLGAAGRNEFIQAAVNVYREHTPDISLTPGARECLQTLGEHFSLGLITDGYSVPQRRKIEALNLEKMISTVIVSDEIGGRSTWKPSPIPFLTACASLGTTPARAVYIGDNPHKDFLGATIAGLASIRLRLGAGMHSRCEPESQDAAPNRVVDSFRAIPDAVSSLSGEATDATTTGGDAHAGENPLATKVMSR
jgi:putative hydrolase of the HAD superfamily